ncbi:hypothetical protein [Nostoc sp. PCC 7107]|uniref:hypothetical protein n=1 Tax=Nostoc sp. PCC 7107 TaxID=317936 RepID=UPI00029EE7C5|nr:hypothetical protein [Nostoc sp. PCC 7107]AFY45471.1 hypothetical protein Nos7107_4953 [Nostoc sp. PCC 7107]
MQETFAEFLARTVRRFEVREELSSRNILVNDDQIKEKEKELNISFLDPNYVEIITQEEVWVKKKE